MRALGVTDTLHHFTASGLGSGLHHVAAWRFAQTAPNCLTAHGQRLGSLAGFGFKSRHHDDFNVLFGEALDVLHEAFFVQTNQTHRFTTVTGSARAANTVHIVFADVGNFIVHHVRQLVDVDATGGNVGSYQGADGAVLETLQGLGAGGLALVAVQSHGFDAMFGQMLGYVVGAEFGAGKDQHLAPVVLVDDVREQCFLFASADRVDGLRDALHRGVARRHLDVCRIAKQAVGQIADFIAERSAEKQGLLLLGHQCQYFFDVVDKTHVEHAVGLVEHQNLYLAQIKRALARMVQQPAGRSHQNVHATAQLVNLRAHADTAKHDHRGQFQVFAINAYAFFNLRRQLTRRRHDQTSHGIHAAPVAQARLSAQALQHGQHEGCGFAGARLGAA